MITQPRGALGDFVRLLEPLCPDNGRIRAVQLDRLVQVLLAPYRSHVRIDTALELRIRFSRTVLGQRTDDEHAGPKRDLRFGSSRDYRTPQEEHCNASDQGGDNGHGGDTTHDAAPFRLR